MGQRLALMRAESSAIHLNGVAGVRFAGLCPNPKAVPCRKYEVTMFCVFAHKSKKIVKSHEFREYLQQNLVAVTNIEKLSATTTIHVLNQINSAVSSPVDFR
jgi:hypothetical protein